MLSESERKQAVANHAYLTMVLSCVFDFEGDASEDQLGVGEVQTTFG